MNWVTTAKEYEAIDKNIYRKLAEEAVERIDFVFDNNRGIFEPTGDYTEGDCELAYRYIDVHEKPQSPNGMARKAAMLDALRRAARLVEHN